MASVPIPYNSGKIVLPNRANTRNIFSSDPVLLALCVIVLPSTTTKDSVTSTICFQLHTYLQRKLKYSLIFLKKQGNEHSYITNYTGITMFIDKYGFFVLEPTQRLKITN